MAVGLLRDGPWLRRIHGRLVEQQHRGRETRDDNYRVRDSPGQAAAWTFFVFIVVIGQRNKIEFVGRLFAHAGKYNTAIAGQPRDNFQRLAMACYRQLQ